MRLMARFMVMVIESYCFWLIIINPTITRCPDVIYGDGSTRVRLFMDVFFVETKPG